MATLIKRGDFYQAKIRRIGLPILSRTFTTKTDAQTWIRDTEWALPFVQFALATAMRKGEILKLKWADVDLDWRVARLWDTKNGEDRAVPLSSRAVEILKTLPTKDEDDQTDYVFRTTSESMKKCFERARQRALLDDLRFHDLRHEATSRMANKLPNVVELSAVTGHKTLAMLGRYYHPRAEELALKLG